MMNICSCFGWMACLVLLVSACEKIDTNTGNNRPYKHTVFANKVYAQANSGDGNLLDLALDVYVPENGRKVNPLILLIHGGGYYSGDKSELANYGAYFASKGFTAAALNYRLGWNRGTATDLCSGSGQSMVEAGYRSIQDTRAALRFLLANATQYHVDAGNIFLAGASAGGVTALSTAFLDANDLATHLPRLEQKLGGLDAVGSSYNQPFAIKGVVNMWGGVLNPAIIGATEKIPVLSFHGSADAVVPFTQGPYAGCATFPVVYGSKIVQQTITGHSNAAVLHVAAGGGHGVYDFKYLSQNTYCFISAILRGEAPSGQYSQHIEDCR